MKIFLIRKQLLENMIEKSSFQNIYKSEKRNIESQLGRFFTKYIASKVYNQKDTTIKTLNRKPFFENSDLQFSISHSHEFIGVAFSENPIGLDIEKFKPRDLKKLSNYFNKTFNTQNDFYQYWTNFEASYKSQLKNDTKTTFKFQNYFVSISSQENNNELKIYEINSPTDITSPIELINLKLVNDNNINDIKLVINEISTASLEFLPPLEQNIE